MRDLNKGKPSKPRPVTRGVGFTPGSPRPLRQQGTVPERHFTDVAVPAPRAK